MTVRNSLLKYSIILILLAGSVKAESLIEDFEDVSDWTIADDVGAFAIDGTKQTEGTYSGKITIDDNTAGSGYIRKDPGAAVDLSGYQFINFSMWIDTADWAAEGQVVYLQMADSGANPCSTDFLVPADFNDEAWTSFSYNLTKATDWSELSCDISDIDWFSFEFSTGSITPTIYAWIDDFHAYNISAADSCTPPGSGDWKIEDNCSLSTKVQITGDLNITTGASLNITGTGELNVTGGEIYMWTPAFLRLDPGAVIQG